MHPFQVQAALARSEGRLDEAEQLCKESRLNVDTLDEDFAEQLEATSGTTGRKTKRQKQEEQDQQEFQCIKASLTATNNTLSNIASIVAPTSVPSRKDHFSDYVKLTVRDTTPKQWEQYENLIHNLFQQWAREAQEDPTHAAPEEVTVLRPVNRGAPAAAGSASALASSSSSSAFLPLHQQYRSQQVPLVPQVQHSQEFQQYCGSQPPPHLWRDPPPDPSINAVYNSGSVDFMHRYHQHNQMQPSPSLQAPRKPATPTPPVSTPSASTTATTPVSTVYRNTHNTLYNPDDPDYVPNLSVQSLAGASGAAADSSHNSSAPLNTPKPTFGEDTDAA